MKKLTQLSLITAAIVSSSAYAAKVDTKGGFGIKSDDGEFSFKVNGRLQIDANVLQSDEIDLNNGSELRRARLAVKGKMRDWGYKLQYDFISSSGVKDAYIAYNGFDNTTVQIGNQREAFGMETNTSSNDVTFIERSLIIDAFDQGRAFGIAAKQWGDNWSLNYGVYGQDVNGSNSEDEQLSFNGRFAYAPVKEKGRLISFGVSALNTQVEDGSTVRLRARPENHQAHTRIVSTDKLNADSYNMLGLESIMQFDSLTILGEYIMQDVNIINGTDASFDGFSVSASYLFDGGVRPYTTKGGKFKRFKPGKNGVWEVAARFSSLDLNDADAGVLGGQVDSITLGANYYINNNMRAMFNIVSADGDENANYDSTSFGARIQVVW